MKISVSIEPVFQNYDFIEGLKLTKSVGINHIEFWSWWDKDIERIQFATEKLNLNVVAFTTRFFDLVNPLKRNEYIFGLIESIKVAQMLNCKNLITQVGDELPYIPRWQQHQSIVQGLKACVPYLQEAGITLLVEPLNILVDHPGYYLYSSAEAFQIINQVNSPYVKVLYDIYHAQVMEGHLIATITKNIDKIGHFHAAGNPGRHELYIGEINYPNVFEAIEETGFDGYMGLEYFPVDDPLLGLWRLVRGEGMN